MKPQVEVLEKLSLTTSNRFKGTQRRDGKGPAEQEKNLNWHYMNQIVNRYLNYLLYEMFVELLKIKQKYA